MILVRICPVCNESFIMIHRNSHVVKAHEWDVSVELHMIQCRVKKIIQEPFTKIMVEKITGL